MTDFIVSRETMLETLKKYGIKDERVLSAMAEVPREEFVPPSLRMLACADMPLEIGLGQTISQPYMVALMCEQMGPEPGKVLEIGTGSGYAAAVMNRMGWKVVTVERLKELHEAARRRLESLGYGEVECILSDGTLGWEKEAPYDAVVVTAAAPSVPEPLLRQLSESGGRLIIPVGGRFDQDLMVYERHGERYDRRRVTSCVFVPLIGKYGWTSGLVKDVTRYAG